jgi:serine phosphatase RsbU (regulator of sigma subunit)
LEIPEEIKLSITKLLEDTGEISSAFTNAVSIQRTYLPSPLLVREYLPESFVLYKPKDNVSGDFYFVSKKFGAVIWVCADCTGHGISAGLLTAICYNYIDQAVNQNNITDPAAIIAHVMPRVESIMRLTDGNMVNKNGMELAVCTLYPQSQILFYTGINRPLYHFSDGNLTEFEPIRYKENFELIAVGLKTQTIHLKPDDTIYLTSDGFIDQFGGTKKESGERFKNKRFKELLSGIQGQNMAQQRETLNQTIEKWRQEAHQEQTDDILVIGVKI